MKRLGLLLFILLLLAAYVAAKRWADPTLPEV
jgi:hypothetical protein